MIGGLAGQTAAHLFELVFLELDVRGALSWRPTFWEFTVSDFDDFCVSLAIAGLLS
jgi:hypothetical protein